MRSPATGIVFCKTEFHLPGVGHIWWSRSQIFYFTFRFVAFYLCCRNRPQPLTGTSRNACQPLPMMRNSGTAYGTA